MPLIFSDPRYSNSHNLRTPYFAELIDIFPTLVELAGISQPIALVPPISGESLAAIIRSPMTSTSISTNQNESSSVEIKREAIIKGLPVRLGALTQFSRCPITASEYLTDISGKGPMVYVNG